MFGIVGLVSDFGYAYYRKEVAQVAAQSAATAAVRNAIAMSGGTCGTNNVVCQSETQCASSISGYGTTNVDKGCLYAITNGFTSTGKQKVTIQTGSGSYNGVTVTYWAAVKVSEQLPQLFSIVTGNTKATLTAKAVVGYIPPTNGGCVYVISPHDAAALSTNGNTGLSSACGVQVNSDSATAIDLSGGNTTITVSGTTNGTANQVLDVGGFNCYGQNTTCISPTPTHSVSSGDPMSGIDAPSYSSSSCTETAPGSYGNSAHPTWFHNLATVNVICGMISPGNNDVVKFESGTYVFTNGISVNNGDMIASGVTFYFPTGSSVSLAGNGNIQLSAPTSGTYQGVLMFQARGNATTAQITGNSSMRVNGVLYFPDANLKFGGNGSSVNDSGTTSVVAKDLTLVGNSSYIQGPASSPYLNTYTGYANIE